MIIGIDPGRTTGGICLLDDGYAEVTPMLSALELMGYFSDVVAPRIDDDPRKVFVFIEKAQSFPGQGISSTFNYAQHFGELVGLMTSFRWPYELVPPITWTREMLAGTVTRKATKKGDKSRNIEAARRLFPDVQELRKAKPHTGLVDALLIAEYGRRKRQGTASKAI